MDMKANIQYSALEWKVTVISPIPCVKLFHNIDIEKNKKEDQTKAVVREHYNICKE